MHKLTKTLETLDYRYLLPLLARTPFGETLAKWRGTLNYHLRRDWRTTCQLDQDVYLRTKMAWHDPTQPTKQQNHRIKQRYQAQSLEEWATERQAIHPLQPLQPITLPKQAIYLTAHYGYSIHAAHWISQHTPTILMTSAIVEDPRVIPAIQQHYQKKYATIPHKHIEGNARQFIQALNQGQSIILLADLPGDDRHHLHTDTPFGRLKLATGAQKLAQLTGVPLYTYLATPHKGGQYHLDLGTGHPPAAIAEALTQLFTRIHAAPQHWWAIDLLPLLKRP